METQALGSKADAAPPLLNQYLELKPISTALPAWVWGQELNQLKAEILVAVRSHSHVLVVGESGTGKEGIAHIIHQFRKQSSQNKALCPFVAQNCGAIPEELAESLLFGHERGAFTSARSSQMGKFELAMEGTLFLDEIQSLSMSTQSKLLRALQCKEAERLGAKKTYPISCQIVASSNIPLELLVAQKRFRKDLYYRLNVCPIYLKPLRHRKSDLPQLIKFLLAKIRKLHRVKALEISPNCFELFLDYSWPGNIRELEHCLLYAALRCQNTMIGLKDMPPNITGGLDDYLKKGSWDIWQA